MRGMGDYQRTRMKHRDARVHMMFDHLRLALDIMEQISGEPFQAPTKPTPDTKAVPVAVPATPIQPKELIPHKLTYTVKEASRALGIGVTKIYELIGEGKLVAVKLGHRTLIKAEAMEAMIDGLPAKPPNG